MQVPPGRQGPPALVNVGVYTLGPGVPLLAAAAQSSMRQAVAKLSRFSSQGPAIPPLCVQATAKGPETFIARCLAQG